MTKRFKYTVSAYRGVDAQLNSVEEWRVHGRNGEIISRHENQSDAHRAVQRYIAEDRAFAA